VVVLSRSYTEYSISGPWRTQYVGLIGKMLQITLSSRGEGLLVRLQ